MRYAIAALACLAVFASPVRAQEVVSDTVTLVKARVVEVLSEGTRELVGLDTTQQYQSIRAEILEGEDAGKVLELDNDYILLEPGDLFYAVHSVNELEGRDVYAVSQPYRLNALLALAAFFVVCLIAFGGLQGMRGLLSLAGSVALIVYALLPGILAGVSPLMLSIGVAGAIVVVGSYITHGVTRTTSAAVVGMIATVVVTGLLSYAAVHMAHLSGFSSEDAAYLNVNTRGSIDFVGLLLGGLIIGFLGILYDAAIGQAVAVEELFGMNKGAGRALVLRRALRIGREHIGALVNTLAIAYVGAYLPLLLLVKLAPGQGILTTINQELFATEIVRTLVGSTGLVLAVPITTAVAVWMLHGRTTNASRAHGHSHSHTH
jgi:uncharacterized membrane protein